MANYDTVNDLIDRLHEALADSSNEFYSEVEEVAALNDGLYQIYQIVHAHHVGFFFDSTPEQITLTPSTNFYSLTDDFGSIASIIPNSDDKKYILFEKTSKSNHRFKVFARQRSDENWGDVDRYLYDVVADKTLWIVPRVTSNMVVDVYTIQEPADMVAGAGTPPIKKIWRPLVVEYAALKLKGKEETGEYTSNETMMKFMLTNLEQYTQPRSEENPEVVEEFSL